MDDFTLELDRHLSNVHMHDESDLQSYKRNLYHYTTANGLIGIINSNCLWATSAIFLNDSNEIKYGLDLISQTLIEYSNNISDTILKRLIKKTLQALNNPRYLSLDIYITCFSEKPDQLSQWKGFANQGSGFSVGFDSKELFFNKRSYPYVLCSLKKVKYDEIIQKNILVKDLNSFYEKLIKIKPEFYKYESLEDEASSVLAYSLFKHSIYFKHKAFEEENEWRIVTPDLSTFNGIRNKEAVIVKFMSNNNNIIPYIELKLKPKHSSFRNKQKLPIDEIIIGPKISFEINKKSVLKILDHNGFKEIKITNSEIILR